MAKSRLYAVRNDYPDRGRLQIDMISVLGAVPASNAGVTILLSDASDTVIDVLDTDSLG